jgi:hypothetical protein
VRLWKFALAVGLLALAGLGPAAAAQAFNSRAGGTIKTDGNIVLRKSSFDVHKGNEKCAADADAPGQIGLSSSGVFCYQANGIVGEGSRDTELSFRYAIFAAALRGDYRGEVMSRSAGLCLDLPQRKTDEGASIQLFGCNGSPAQIFTLDDKDDTLKVLDRCLTAPDGAGDVAINTCRAGDDKQRWRVDGSGRLVAHARCLDIRGHSDAGAGARLQMAGCDDSKTQRWFEDTGYKLKGRALVKNVGRPNELSCNIDRDEPSKPVRRFGCTATWTGGRDPGGNDPGPIWTVNGAAADAARVVFIGDSVTAGFGYCGTEGGDRSAGVACSPNESIANNWLLGPNNLNDCAPDSPPKVPNDRCSNNNARGAPWDVGPWFDVPGAPTIAYPFQLAKSQRPPDDATVEDWAVTGAWPAHWDPKDGAFRDRTNSIKDSWVGMTLGANPLLSYYMAIALPLLPYGKCANSTMVRRGSKQLTYYAAPLDGERHQDGYWGVLHCFNEEWAALRNDDHLLNIYKTLLEHDNHVLVVGYPVVCPWSFGIWQPGANPDGPAKGNACPGMSAPTWGNTGRKTSQWEQAKLLVETADARMRDLAVRAGRETGKADNIRFVSPDQAEFGQHQAWDSQSWIFKNDTWVHPNEKGHEQLAKTVARGMCDAWKHWCGDPPHWKP